MIEKTYLKTKPECKVKFVLPAEQICDDKSVFLVGDFNEWDTSSHPMRKQKSGVFAATLNLKVGQTYQFRYVTESQRWLNDDSADGYSNSPVSPDQNSVLSL
ncbi:glycoside hydrolase [Marinomonas hwangdonensis]|uniref:Glycoside hydrolase n=1 Tax=Marinomonas hwangdonensis TaxID=1053647 RepID=A0A3M8Q4A9_9GAMM|nr:isoamylase early set domain-containing protein [Marinomonas hwangdonensis]MDP5056895.1 isoamylase early set domain-containing protein [Marinomonas hwangdonensis]RNF50562.1 glycoside hydrolase [Marinomonas hwangdonensis]